MRRPLIIAGVAGSAFGTWALLPLGGQAAPTAAELGRKIDRAQGKVDFRRGKEKVLTRDIAAYSARERRLEARLGSLKDRQDAVEQDLDAKRRVLRATQTELRAERARLVRLQRRLGEARSALAARLVEQYETGRPDLLSVVVEAKGLSEIVEQSEYLHRLSDKDRLVIGLVTGARRDARTTERRLDGLERRQGRTAQVLQSRRDEIVRVKESVASVERSVRTARGEKRAVLGRVKLERKELEEDLSKMQAQQAKISGALRGALPAGAIKKGTGRFIYPMNGTFTSPFGTRWGRLHAGIDIAAPIGTPIRAADGGRVAIAGVVSGYGNYTCIQHSDSLSTCYGHQSSIAVHVGQTVSQGQVIGLCGNTGHSTGPHLHFEVRVGGVPRDPMGYL